MSSTDLVKAMVYFSQTLIGTLGNLFLLCHCFYLHFTKFQLSSTNLILKHLAVANSLVILFRGVPETMAALGLKDFLSDLGCKLVFYVHRIGRGVSIGNTCLLSVFQVITICPINSRWAKLKSRTHKYVRIFSILCWIFHMLLSIIVPFCVTDKWHHINITYQKEFGYCSSIHHKKSRTIMHTALLSLPDVLCVVLMLCTSSSMISILYRHNLRMQHMHMTNMTYRSSPETRATKTIILLVSTFVCFYSLSLIFHAFFIFYNNPNRLLVCTAAVVTGSYATVSPFLLMKHYPSISNLLDCIRKTKTCHIMRSI
ncbi:vomeronasal type-1 receptor 4-like [Octodon degus]|uniref:Vomeronasal type-1 receptor n=1 Tax=Octodon degus TaxID=10160 RepID=A0A6P3G0J2_OCTDE|nr:vomeronasal type-1 receptor 4-like [Octodon degus]